MDEDEGLRLVLSPVQLAAVLQSAHVSPAEIATNRFWGSVQVLGGALELVGASALLLAPEPTMLTKVGGSVLMVHGSDTVSTGLRQMWTGHEEKTLTAQSATAVAHGLGANSHQAEIAGQIVDTAVPLFVATVVAAERIMAVRAGRIVLQETAATAKSGVNLAEEEAAGGHTIAEHVGRTEGQLRTRLVNKPKIPAATSFRSLQEAEGAISDALRVSAPDIQAWASDAAKTGPFVRNFSAGKSIGYGVVRSTGQMTDMQTVRFVLRKTNIAGKVYFLLTAYPTM